MLPRTLEPEVMDSAAEAEDYDAMDHAQVNRVFVDDFLSALTAVPAQNDRPWRIFDAGTGTAQIPIELMGRGLRAEITAADLAEQMLIIARRNVTAAGFSAAIQLIRSDCKHVAETGGSFDAVMSNSIVHHIAEPASVIESCWQMVRPGGLLFFRDLARPDNESALNRLVETYAATANDHGRQMFRDSLHAALTAAEAQTLASSVGIPPEAVRMTSDRHWTLAAIKP